MNRHCIHCRLWDEWAWGFIGSRGWGCFMVHGFTSGREGDRRKPAPSLTTVCNCCNSLCMGAIFSPTVVLLVTLGS